MKRFRVVYEKAKSIIKAAARKTARRAGDAIRHGPDITYRCARGIPFALRTVRAGYPRVPGIVFDFQWIPQPLSPKPIETPHVPGAYLPSSTRSIETEEIEEGVTKTTVPIHTEDEAAVDGVQDAPVAYPTTPIRPHHITPENNPDLSAAVEIEQSAAPAAEPEQRLVGRMATPPAWPRPKWRESIDRILDRFVPNGYTSPTPSECRSVDRRDQLMKYGCAGPFAKANFDAWSSDLSERSDILRRLERCREGLPNGPTEKVLTRMRNHASSAELQKLLKLCEDDPDAFEYIKMTPFPHIDPGSDYGKLYYAQAAQQSDQTRSRYFKEKAQRVQKRRTIKEVPRYTRKPRRALPEEELPYSPESAEYFDTHSVSDFMSTIALTTVIQSPARERQARRISNHNAAGNSLSRPSSSNSTSSSQSDVSRLADDLGYIWEPSPEWVERTRKIREAEAAEDAATQKEAKLQKKKEEEERKRKEEVQKKREEEQEAKLEAEREAEREKKHEEEIERKKTLEIVRPLPEKWDTAVDNFLAVKSDFSKKGSISRGDLKTLLPQSDKDGVGWLNDEVINNYLNLVAAKARVDAGQEVDKQNRPKYHAFSSHMYSTWKKKEDMKSITRWASRAKIDADGLLGAERIFIPVNAGYHWTLLTVDGTKRTITFFDSLGGKGSDYTRFARLWVENTLGKAYKEEEWEVIVQESSRQKNSLDCGAFVCMNSLALAKGREPKDAFNDTHIGNARRMIAATLMKTTIDEDFGW